MSETKKPYGLFRRVGFPGESMEYTFEITPNTFLGFDVNGKPVCMLRNQIAYNITPFFIGCHFTATEFGAVIGGPELDISQTAHPVRCNAATAGQVGVDGSTTFLVDGLEANALVVATPVGPTLRHCVARVIPGTPNLIEVRLFDAAGVPATGFVNYVVFNQPVS